MPKDGVPESSKILLKRMEEVYLQDGQERNSKTIAWYTSNRTKLTSQRIVFHKAREGIGISPEDPTANLSHLKKRRSGRELL